MFNIWHDRSQYHMQNMGTNALARDGCLNWLRACFEIFMILFIYLFNVLFFWGGVYVVARQTQRCKLFVCEEKSIAK